MTNYRTLLQPRMAKVAQEASFLRRLASFIIDILVLDLIVTAPFTPLFSRIMNKGIGASLSVSFTGKEYAAIIALFLIIFAYFVLFEYLLGQTLGMMIMRTRVTGDTSLARLLLRNSFILPFFPFIAFWIIEPVAILFWRRSALEYITNTRTLHQRSILL